MRCQRLAAYLMLMGAALSILPGGAALADILICADHSAVSGKVISQNENQVVFQADGENAPEYIPRSQVLQVVLTDAHGHVLPNQTAAVALPATEKVPAASQPAGQHVLRIEPLSRSPSRYATDEQIGQAISKGAKYLADQFSLSTLKEGGQNEEEAGADALAVYALLQCGLSIDEPQYGKDSQFMKDLIAKMKSLTPGEHFNTYSRGIRATCLALINRPDDHKALEADVQSLLESCTQGSYTYDDPNAQPNQDRVSPGMLRGPNMVRRRNMVPRPAFPRPDMNPAFVVFDNSNSQYGLLGVWAGAEVGVEIPNTYWEQVQQHWTQCQCGNGQWSYQGMMPIGTYSMTMAGLASMFVCHEFIDGARFGAQVGREPFSPPLAKGLEWMESADNSVPPQEDGYSIYGLERVGLACGFKYFGSHDWYREVSTQLLASQHAFDGAWDTSGMIEQNLNTAYILLFLSRGRHPILMNKLRFEHYWDNRPRDMANLASFATSELEKTFNWQVVDLQHDWHDWTDAPILYIASHVAPQLADADYAKIRAFVNAGGMLFTQADGDSAAFNDFAEKTLLKKVFPDYELKKIPDDSPIFSVCEPMKQHPPLEGVSNGERLLWVHSPVDISQWWQQRASKTHKDAFDLGMNLFVYAAGKRDFQNRIATNYIPQPPASTTGDGTNVVNVARVKYPLPTWDPEPYAWTRFGNYLQWQTSVKVQTQAVDMEKLGDLSTAAVPLAHLTGTMPYTPSDAQLQSVKKYVDNGGILFIDACGGGGFNDSIQSILKKAFPDVLSQPITAQSPLMQQMLDGMSALSSMPVRQYVISLGQKPAGFMAYHSGKGMVIYSAMDVTNGLLGSQTWGIAGYSSPFCLEFMKNLVLWSAQGEPTTPHLTPQPIASLPPAPSSEVAPGSNASAGGQAGATAKSVTAHLDNLPPSAVATDQIGGDGGGPFTHVSAAAQPVVGFAYQLGHWDKPVIADLLPVFDVAAPSEANLQYIIARDGYVVAGVLDDADEVNTVAIKVIFARWKNGQVDLTDSYQSGWIGTPDGHNPVQLAGHGETVIGDFGRKGMNLDALGLVVIPKVASAAAGNGAASATQAANAAGNLTQAAQGNALVQPIKSKQIGNNVGTPFSYVSPTRQPPYGIAVISAAIQNIPTLFAMEPIFDPLPAKQDMPGSRNALGNGVEIDLIAAKPGYVVGGLLVDADKTRVVAVKVIFARYRNDQIDPTDTYRSDWIGKPDNNHIEQLGGKGEMVIGIYGTAGQGMLSIGLVLLPKSAKAVEAASPATAPGAVPIGNPVTPPQANPAGDQTSLPPVTAPEQSSGPSKGDAPAANHDANFLHLLGLPKGAATTLQIGGIAPMATDYKNIGEKGAPVVAFRYKLRSVDGKSVIHRFEPLYFADPAAPPDAHWQMLQSREGYVVAGLLIHTDRKTVLGIRIIFARYKDGRVDMNDSYQSDWIGDPDENEPRKLAGQGERVIGVFGRYKNNVLLSLGLIVLPPDSAGK